MTPYESAPQHRGSYKPRIRVDWTADVDAALFQAWYGERLSAYACAAKLCQDFGVTSITRNAIIGRLHRKVIDSGWPVRVTPSSIANKAGAATRKAAHAKHFPGLLPTKKSRQGVPRAVKPPPVPKSAPIKGSGPLIDNGKTISETTGCLYATGHDNRGRHVFCDGPKVSGTAWCEGHHVLVYQRRA